MRRVEAKPDARPDLVRQRVAQLLEPCAQGRSRSCRPLDPDPQVTGHRRQTLRIPACVARESGITLVDVVPRMRDDSLETERLRPRELRPEAFDTPRPEYGIGRRQVDQIAVVRDDLESISRDLASEPLDGLGGNHRLPPLIRR